MKRVLGRTPGLGRVLASRATCSKLQTLQLLVGDYPRFQHALDLCHFYRHRFACLNTGVFGGDEVQVLARLQVVPKGTVRHELVHLECNRLALYVVTVDKFPQDLTVIRMNVRDFDEAYQFLLSKGFKPASKKGSTTKTSSSEDTLMFSPSGFAICISEHIRK